MNKCMKVSDQNFMPVYNRYPIAIEKGDGVYLFDNEGKKYLDFAAGIAVFAFGYNNKEYNDALKEQIDKIIHTSNLYYNVPAADAAEKFNKASGMDRVFFTNSGTEAIEGAIKLARKYAYNKTKTNDSEIISMNHSFHGRSTGALAITGQPKYQEAFRPLINGVVFADFNDLDSVKEKISEKTCAIVVEPIQGEGGLYPAKKEFLQGLRALCDENDIVLIFDEIQCGMGRTGSMFAYQDYGVKPDIMTSAKALGCGVPVGAFAATERVANAFELGDHGTTYGFNPLVTAAVSKVFDMFESYQLIDHVKEVSAYLEEKLDELVKDYDFVIERRGKGLMQGLELSIPAKDIIGKAMENGLIIISAGSNILRFVPPLVITKDDVDTMITILKKCL
ncbi:acetylornithine/N-succinyldiaminopimelate aminotransferase [Anaerosporobacter mobilis DSM 15930]|uniref:Acetylornithine aminotransferase n=1 Tax=Anaerosporobacter mobilis DSM 15930 TaxID=1120996 RepID=A0A1M7KFK4_9FIRM|nr:aspartate aminotransferase family protein [Anaerosporobacter mobilis]SHM63851.1 acetylornithine/N-succinyldiaminopimelate aminotransferase [Anaerosporobacter mobilis DSM 15930]